MKKNTFAYLVIALLLWPRPVLAASEKLTIFYAANLTTVMKELTAEFKKTHPDIELIAESSGSVLAVKKITELKRSADIVFTADYTLIQDMLVPEYADTATKLFRDRVVVAFSEKSRFTNEINPDNWYKILLRPEVKFGYANPNLAPIGYHTLIAWKLADIYYQEDIYGQLKKKCPEDYVRPDVSELLPLVESMSLDYLFIYQSTAQQHNLKFINLPPEIDLSSEELTESYKKATLTVKDKTGKESLVYGKPIIFAYTILKDAPNKKAAEDFIRLLLSQTGQEIMKRNFQPQIKPLSD